MTLIMWSPGAMGHTMSSSYSPMSRPAILLTEEEAEAQEGEIISSRTHKRSGRVGFKHRPTPAPPAVTLH